MEPMRKKELKPTVIFIFGGSGDLTQRKLIPALYNLFIDHFLPAHFSIISIGRTDFNNKSYKAHVKTGVQQFSRRKDDVKQSWSKFSAHIGYRQMDLENEKTYTPLAAQISKLEKEWGEAPNLVF